MIIGFHNPNEENGYLSNWYPCRFTIDGIEHSSMEQFMMHQKAVLFHDTRSAEQIMKTDDPAEIKQLGRLVSGYDNLLWNGVRQIVVFEGLMAKFSQNDELKDKLVSTGSAILAECAVKDLVWGIGLSITDPDRYDISKWRGQNLLGFALMKVRDKL